MRQTFKESALQKVYNRGNKTLTELADELNINVYTLKSWMRDNQAIKPDPRHPQSSQNWSAELRLLALQESYASAAKH
jgi:transposase-like protein